MTKILFRFMVVVLMGFALTAAQNPTCKKAEPTKTEEVGKTDNLKGQPMPKPLRWLFSKKDKYANPQKSTVDVQEVEPQGKSAFMLWIGMGILLLILSFIPIVYTILPFIGVFQFIVQSIAYGNAIQSFKTFRNNPGKYTGKGFPIFVALLYPLVVGAFVFFVVGLAHLAFPIGILVSLLAFSVTMVVSIVNMV